MIGWYEHLHCGGIGIACNTIGIRFLWGISAPQIVPICKRSRRVGTSFVSDSLGREHAKSIVIEHSINFVRNNAGGADQFQGVCCPLTYRACIRDVASSPQWKMIFCKTDDGIRADGENAVLVGWQTH